MDNPPVYLVMAEGPGGVIHKSVKVCSTQKETMDLVGRIGKGFRVYVFNNGTIYRSPNKRVLWALKLAQEVPPKHIRF